MCGREKEEASYKNLEFTLYVPFQPSQCAYDLADHASHLDKEENGIHMRFTFYYSAQARTSQ